MLAATGHGNVSAARKLIRKRAADLGVPLDSLPGFGSGSEDEEESGGKSVAAAQRQRWARAGVVSLSGSGYENGELELSDPDIEGGPLEDIMNRHPDLFLPGRAGLQSPAERLPYEQRGRRRERRQPQFRPSRPGQVTTRTRAHGPDNEDASDSRQPAKGGQVHTEVQRYLDMHREFGGAEKPYGSVVTHRRSG